MKLGTEVGLRLRQIVLNGDPVPLPQRGTSPQVFGYVCCGQMAGWIKMQLGTDYGGRPRPRQHCVSYSPKGHSPQFSVDTCYGRTAGWIKMPLGREVGLSPGHIVLDGDPAPPQKGTAPNFRFMPAVAKRLDGSRCHLAGR